MHKNLRRGAVVLATIVVCVAGLVSPASAATLTGTITGGTVTLINSTGTVTDTIPLGGTTTTGAGCSSTIAVHTVGSTTSVTTWQVSSFTTVSVFVLGTTHYVVVSTKTTSTTLNTAGTVTSITTTSATLNSSLLNLRVEVYAATDNTSTSSSCAHGTTRACLFTSVALSVQGTYNGNIHTPVASNTVSLSASGTLGTTTPPCVAPFTSYTGGTTTIAGLTGEVVTVT